MSDVSESLISLTKNEGMSELLIVLSQSLIRSFLGKKRAIRLEIKRANSQPCWYYKLYTVVLHTYIDITHYCTYWYYTLYTDITHYILVLHTNTGITHYTLELHTTVYTVVIHTTQSVTRGDSNPRLYST